MRPVAKELRPEDERALVAVDLGAESCRVSLLCWKDGGPEIRLIHRFANQPREVNGGLKWDLRGIEAGLDEGLRMAAGIASEGVRSVAVDGWAVDYVRVDESGRALDDPFCYRDERTVAAEEAVHGRCSAGRMRELTGIQQLRINTLYQLHADAMAGLPAGKQWMNLPEYVLSRWGGERVAELTNATHTQMVELGQAQWCEEIFRAVGLDVVRASRIVLPGTDLGVMKGQLAELEAFRDTRLIAPACHDTASAIAGIPATGDDWAYISSGTWSLVGTVLDEPCNSRGAREENFTNLGGVGGRTLFHKNVNGMWLLRQCIEQWAAEGVAWSVAELVEAAEKLPKPEAVFDVDAPELLLQGRMPQRISVQMRKVGSPSLDESAENAPAFASLIFHSLAAKYAKVLQRMAQHSGKELKRLYVVGGGSQNVLLNRLTVEATGLELHRGSGESSTIGNFAVQMMALERTSGGYSERLAEYADLFARAMRTA